MANVDITFRVMTSETAKFIDGLLQVITWSMMTSLLSGIFKQYG